MEFLYSTSARRGGKDYFLDSEGNIWCKVRRQPTKYYLVMSK